MNRLKLLILSLLAVVCLSATGQTDNSKFVTVDNGHFLKDGKPYYYVGTNFWYGAILGSEGQGGDRQRLGRELDLMKKMGIDNLRILVGSDGERGVTTKVEPTLQVQPGVYNDTILAGLDYLLQQMGQRGMKAVLYLNNAWEWSGGYSFYLEQAGAGHQPRPNEDGYQAYMQAMAQYAFNEKAHELFYQYVRDIIGRVAFDCGVGVGMSWDDEGSGVTIDGCKEVATTLKEVFGFKNARFVGFRNAKKPGEDNLRKVIYGQCAAGAPVDMYIEGHAVVAVGYGQDADGTCFLSGHNECRLFADGG